MPLFSAQLPSLTASGPVIDIQLMPMPAALAAMQAGGGATPSPISLTAMIDTGATKTVVQGGLCTTLGLHPTGTETVKTASSAGVVCNVFAVRIVIPSTMGGKSMPLTLDTPIVEAPLQGQHIQCLLGRDFLAHGVFVYLGPTNSFSFSA